ncbi:hypothetical protein [Deinococcus aestuarii]|uniref:hypothetical protein n=1 Tax=Deinococcus aestuarii TaxID=2774531 RepID=UPI001C0CAA82|nr:hypothetical protein [Deinococcus aestuarii]
MPDHLPVTVKQGFVSCGERRDSPELVVSPRATGYVVSPNVRLNDVFLISRATEHRQSVLGHPRDQHVGVLIFEERDFRLVLAIMGETVARLLGKAIQERGKPKILISDDGSTRPVVPWTPGHTKRARTEPDRPRKNPSWRPALNRWADASVTGACTSTGS